MTLKIEPKFMNEIKIHEKNAGVLLTLTSFTLAMQCTTLWNVPHNNVTCKE